METGVSVLSTSLPFASAFLSLGLPWEFTRRFLKDILTISILNDTVTLLCTRFHTVARRGTTHDGVVQTTARCRFATTYTTLPFHEQRP